MAKPINTPVTGNIWHLSIDDLFAPLPEKTRLGGPGPFVINLSVSTAPIDLPAKGFDSGHAAHVYQVQRTEDRRMRYRLRLGPFANEDDADAILERVRDVYPGALTATADADDLRAIAALQAKTASAVRVVETVKVVATPKVVDTVKVVEPMTVAKAIEPIPAIRAVERTAVKVTGPGPTVRAIETAPPVLPLVQALAAAPLPAITAPAMSAVLPVLLDRVVTPPVAQAPAVVVAPTPVVAPAAVAIPAAVVVPAVLVVPAAPPPRVEVRPVAPPVAAAPKPVVAPPSRPVVAVPYPIAPAPRSAPAKLVVPAPQATRSVPSPTATPPNPVEESKKRLLSVESTQTVRALTVLELESEQASRWFVIQLSLSEEAFDSEAVPNLDIFDVYRLYSVAGIDQGRIVHALRLGFFAEEMAAAAVASYLSEFYENPSVKRVSSAERERFADQRFEPRKDVGATGKHAVIEITNERYIREKRNTSARVVSQNNK